MPYVRHHESHKGAVAQVLGVGEVPETQVSLAMGGTQQWDTFPSNELASSSSPGDNMTWTIPPSQGMTSVGETYILFKCQKRIFST